MTITKLTQRIYRRLRNEQTHPKETGKAAACAGDPGACRPCGETAAKAAGSHRPLSDRIQRLPCQAGRSQTLAASDSTAEGTDGPADSADQTPATSAGTIDLSNQRFSIHYTRNVVSTDFGGEPCLLVYYDYTNNGESSSSAMVDVNLTAYQNDAALEAAIPANSDEAVDAFMKEIQPGETVNVCQAFSLNDMSPVTLHASDAFGLDTGITAAQTLNLQ